LKQARHQQKDEGSTNRDSHKITVAESNNEHSTVSQFTRRKKRFL
jgi:hypothetical protein